MTYKFIVENEGEIVFQAEKPSFEMLQEEIGRYERMIIKQHE